MDELPDLAFEQVLSYLSLQDLIRSKGVSRRWYSKITAFRVKSLFFSEWSSGYIRNKHQLVTGAFAQNYIHSSQFEAFFSLFGRSMLANLAHLRVCDLHLNEKVQASALIKILNSFDHLQSLDLVRIENLGSRFDRLSLPNVLSLRLENLKWISNLTIDAPRMVRLHVWNLQNALLEIVHVESIRTAVLETCVLLEDLERLKNLQTLYCQVIYLFGHSFLSSLTELQEVHFNSHLATLEELHDQRQRLGRTDLKIYYRGLHLERLQDYADFTDYPVLDETVLGCAIENYERVADRMPLYCSVYYSRFESIVSRVPNDFWKRFTNLKAIEVDRTIENVKQFFDFLRCFNEVCSLAFNRPQPQRLLDELPDHLPSLESLEINNQNPDLAFILKLSHLIDISLDEINAEFIERVAHELKFLRVIRFYENDTEIRIQFGKLKKCSLKIGKSSQTIHTDFDELIRILSGQK